MAISVGTNITTNVVQVNSSNLATTIERCNNAVKTGLIQSWVPSPTADAVIITIPPSSAQVVADHGGNSGYNTFANAYFTAWGHSIT